MSSPEAEDGVSYGVSARQLCMGVSEEEGGGAGARCRRTMGSGEVAEPSGMPSTACSCASAIGSSRAAATDSKAAVLGMVMAEEDRVERGSDRGDGKDGETAKSGPRRGIENRAMMGACAARPGVVFRVCSERGQAGGCGHCADVGRRTVAGLDSQCGSPATMIHCVEWMRLSCLLWWRCSVVTVCAEPEQGACVCVDELNQTGFLSANMPLCILRRNRAVQVWRRRIPRPRYNVIIERSTQAGSKTVLSIGRFCFFPPAACHLQWQWGGRFVEQGVGWLAMRVLVLISSQAWLNVGMEGRKGQLPPKPDNNAAVPYWKCVGHWPFTARPGRMSVGDGRWAVELTS